MGNLTCRRKGILEAISGIVLHLTVRKNGEYAEVAKAEYVPTWFNQVAGSPRLHSVLVAPDTPEPGAGWMKEEIAIAQKARKHVTRTLGPPDAPRFLALSGQPLWTPDELAEITGVQWRRRPGPDWFPEKVRMSVPRWKTTVNPAWLSNGIVFARNARQVARLRRSSQKSRGCIVTLESLAGRVQRNVPVAIVDNIDLAVRALAVEARHRSQAKYIGVTGTVGKTTTRYMIAHSLSEQGKVHSNIGSWQNDYSFVMQAIASTPHDADYLVFEHSIDIAGALKDMTRVVRPDVVVLTQIDVAHLDNFTAGDLEGADPLKIIVDRKLELSEGLQPDGAVILNTAMPLFARAQARMRDAGRRVITFGEHGADATLVDDVTSGAGQTVVADIFGQRYQYTLQIPGRFMALNSLAALAAIAHAGADVEKAALALSAFEPLPGRARVIKLPITGRTITLIDDSFNATPASIRSTLHLLGQILPSGSGRRIAVLGDIAHLGPQSAEIHASFADDAEANGIDLVFTTGPEMLHLHRALTASQRISGVHAEDRYQLVELLRQAIRSGDVITVKASVPSRFGYIVAELQRWATELA
jgi:UDP-N-acetylmuramoyl-tripeptide--D-alanyl-D-alanine ligase